MAVRFSLFDNSPNRTQIGIFKSVCSEQDKYTYVLEKSKAAELKICDEEPSSCRVRELATLSNSTADLFTMSASDGYLMTNAQITSETLLSLAGLDANVERYRYMAVLLVASVPNLALSVPIEITIQSVPRLENFSERLVLVEGDSATVTSKLTPSTDQFNSADGRCIYTYRFAGTGVDSVISRFVRVDKLSMTHLEPDFRFDTSSSCSSSFFIYNNGCVAIKWPSESTLSAPDAVGRLGRCQVLRAGEYKLEFKLCFYDANKVTEFPLFVLTYFFFCTYS